MNNTQEVNKYFKAYENICMRKSITSTSKLLLFRMMNRFQFFVGELKNEYTEGHLAMSMALGVSVTSIKHSIIELNRAGFIVTKVRNKLAGNKKTKELESVHFVDIDYILNLDHLSEDRVVEYSSTKPRSKWSTKSSDCADPFTSPDVVVSEKSFKKSFVDDDDLDIPNF